MPHPIYKDILYRLQQHPKFKDRQDALGRRSKPVYLKLLAALRVMGRGECFDTCEELCDIAAPTLTSFFHDFTEWLATCEWDTHVSMPTTNDEIEYVLRQYSALGFPGCIGSIDCCHIHWDRCPATETNRHTGKEGYPTLSYEVTTIDRQCVSKVCVLAASL